MNITEKIQRLRKEKGWTIAEFSRETGIPTVSLRVMLGRNNPNNYSMKSLIKIADVLGVTVSYLTLEENETARPKISEQQRKEMLEMFAQTLDKYFEVQKDKSV